ncbi:hypothetical protein LINPERHAP2_LOCUS17012, partial [Linum perenne]
GEDDDDDPRCPTIRIPLDEKRRVRRKFDNAIIVSTLGKCFPFPFMSRKLPQLWAKKGQLQVSDVGWGYYVVKFETVSDYQHALFGGPWMVGDHYVVIQEWRPYFQPENYPITTLRVWVRLPGIPLEYYDATILRIIGDRIGKTVRLDHTTLEGSRGNFARICVEVDLSKPLLSKYRLRRPIRRVEYEGLHTICYVCGCYGHGQGECPASIEDVEAAENVITNPVFQKSTIVEDRPEVEEDFGPWMKVTRTGRKNRKAAPVIVDKTAPMIVAQTAPVVVDQSAGQPEKKEPFLGNKFDALMDENIQGDISGKDGQSGDVFLNGW